MGALCRTAALDPKLPYGGPADQSPRDSERGPYDKRREYDAEATVRFCAPRLYESGLIKSNPKKIIAEKTDWRFFNELKRELKARTKEREVTNADDANPAPLFDHRLISRYCRRSARSASICCGGTP